MPSPIIGGGVIAPGGAAPPVGSSFCSVDSMVAECRKLLNDEPLVDNVSANGGGSLTSGTTSVQFGDGTLWSVGDWFDWRDGTNDQAIITAGTANPFTVQRGWHDTTAVNHAAGALILKTPAYTYDQLSTAITDIVNTMSPVVWSIVTTDLTPNADGGMLYAMPSDFLGLIDISQQSLATPNDIVRYGVPGVYRMNYYVFEEWHAPTALSSTPMLRFPAVDNTTNPIHVTYRGRVTTSTVECGSMSDYVVYAACARVLGGRENPRVNNEDISEGDSSVGPGARMNASLRFAQMAEGKKAELQRELRLRGRPMRRYVR